MSFRVPEEPPLPPWVVDEAYLAGLEGIPWPSVNRLQDGLLTISRPIAESGCLHVLWTVAGQGPLVLSTASLMEREQPYQLAVELARGTLHRLRTQLADWLAGGMQRDDDLHVLLREAHDRLVAAVTSQHQPPAADRHAQQCLERTLEAGERLCRQYTLHMLPQYRAHKARRMKLLGARLSEPTLPPDAAAPLADSLNILALTCDWRQLQPSDDQFAWESLDRQVAGSSRLGLSVCLGPLIQLDAALLPEWLYLWEDDYDSLLGYATAFVGAMVQRYRGRVQLWHVSAGLNRRGSLSLGEEEQLHLALNTLEAVRRSDPQTPAFVSIDQPWGEYLHGEDLDLSPLHFADSLVRAELGMAGVGLDVNLGFWPGGTLPRDMLEIARHLDRWSLLGLPLLVLLTTPRSDRPDPLARRQVQVFANHAPSPASVEERLLPLLLAKPAVHGVIWNQWSDAEPHPLPNAGMFDADGQPRPALDAMRRLKSDYFGHKQPP